MSLAAWLHSVFILLGLMAIVASGLPTTKQTAIERPTILRKSQPTIGEPTASRWPTLAEVITNAGNAIKPSASLLDMLQSEEEKRKIMSDAPAAAVTTPAALLAATGTTTTQKITANVIDVAQLGITDFGLWNEDNIKLDFITVNDLRRLIEKGGGKLDHSIYAQSASHVASLNQKDMVGPSTAKTSTAMTTTSSPPPFSSSASLTTLATTIRRRKFSTAWLPSVSFNLSTTTSSTTESTPYPPLTLSLGAWQITEEDLPIYVGSAAGVLLLIILLLAVTTWRCCIVPSNPANHHSSTVKAKDDLSSRSSPTSSQNNNGQQQPQPRLVSSLESANGNGASSTVMLDYQQSAGPEPQSSEETEAAEPQRPTSITDNKPPPPESPGTSRFIVNLSSVIADECQKSHDSMVCLSGTRVESRIVSPGHTTKSSKVSKQSPVATLTQRRTTPFDANSSPTHSAGKETKLEVCDELQASSMAGNATYVRVPPIDNYVSTTNGATTFHTFQPNNSRSTSDKNSSSSSPDDGGFVSTAGNKGSSLSTPGTVRSTPSSEALDVVADLRYESLRFRSLPLHKNDSAFSKETNGNLLDGPNHHGIMESPEPNMSVPLVGPKQYAPVQLNGNANNAQNIEDLYAKVNFTAKSKSRDSPTGQVAVVQPLTLNRIAQKMSSSSPGSSSGSGVMTTFVPKANGNMMMMTSSTIVTSFDETDDITEDSSASGEPKASTFSRMSSEETSSLFYNMKTSL